MARRGLNTKTAQDRPIPIEPGSVKQQRLSSASGRINQNISQIKDHGTRESIRSIFDLLIESADDRGRFDAIRDNFETLWKRTNGLTSGTTITGGTGSSGSGQSATPATATPSSPPVKDNHFYGYDADGGISIANTNTLLQVDTEIEDDSYYSHTADSGIVEILKSGEYEIDIDAGFETDSSDVVEMVIQRDTGSGYADVEGSKAYASNAAYISIAGDSTTGSVYTPTQSLSIVGTAYEIETAVADNEVTIGLPDDVIITNTLQVGGDTTITGNLTVDTNTLFVDATNNRVGIGTTSPVQKLTIDGVTRFREAGATRYRCDFYVTGGTVKFNSYDDTGAVYRPIYIDGNPTHINLVGGLINLHQETGVGGYATTGNALTATQDSIDSTTLTTTTSKQLGAYIKASGISNITGEIQTGISFGEGYAGVYAKDDGASSANGLGFFTGNSSAVTEAMFIDSSQNVSITAGDFTVDTDLLYVETSTSRIGINESNPASVLDIKTADPGDGIRVENTASSASLRLTATTTTDARVDFFTSGVVRGYIGFDHSENVLKINGDGVFSASQNLTIDTSGNVSVGDGNLTVDTGNFLVNDGDASITNSSNTLLYVKTSNVNGNATLELENDVQKWGLATRGGVSDSFVIRDASAGADALTIAKSTLDVTINAGDLGITTGDINLSSGVIDVTRSQNAAAYVIVRNPNDGAGASSYFIATQGTATPHGLNLFVQDASGVVTGYAQRANFTTDTGSNGITIAARKTGGDIRFYAGDASPVLNTDEIMTIASTGVTIDSGSFTVSSGVLFAYGGIRLDDNDILTLGTGGDAQIYYNGVNLIINPDQVGTGVMAVAGKSDLGGDTTVSSGDLTVSAGDVYLDDNVLITGSGVIQWGSNALVGTEANCGILSWDTNKVMIGSKDAGSSLSFYVENTEELTIDTSGNMSLLNGNFKVDGQTVISSGLAYPLGLTGSSSANAGIGTITTNGVVNIYGNGTGDIRFKMGASWDATGTLTATGTSVMELNSSGDLDLLLGNLTVSNGGIILSNSSYGISIPDFSEFTLGDSADAQIYWDSTNFGIATNSGNIVLNPFNIVDINGGLDVSGDLTVDTSTLYVKSSTNQVAIGSTSFYGTETLSVNGDTYIRGGSRLQIWDATNVYANYILNTGNNMAFYNYTGTLAMEVDGNADVNISNDLTVTGDIIVNDAAGQIKVGNDTFPFFSSSADDIMVSTTGHTGITIWSPDAYQSSLFFADHTGGMGAFAAWNRGTGGVTKEFSIGTNILSGKVSIRSGLNLPAIEIDGNRNVEIVNGTLTLSLQNLDMNSNEIVNSGAITMSGSDGIILGSTGKIYFNTVLGSTISEDGTNFNFVADTSVYHQFSGGSGVKITSLDLTLTDGDIYMNDLAYIEMGDDPTYYTRIWYDGNSGAGDFYINANSASIMHFQTGASTKLKIQAASSIFYHGVIINENGLAYDTRIESDNNTHMLFVDGSADYVGIGQSTPRTTLDVAGDITSDGDLILPKTSGKGIKVDTTTPTFGWKDLLGTVSTEKSNTSPTLATYRGGAVKEYQFSVNDDIGIDFHMPHDYVPGTDIYLHIHWSHNSSVVTGGQVSYEYALSYSKGHSQAAFGAEVTGTIVSSASTTQYYHIIEEAQVSAGTPSAAQLDSDDLEVDGVILCNIKLTANAITYSSGGPVKPFVHYVDIHYQSTNIGTKDKAPNFYA